MNWVSKTQYLERKIKRLEKVLALLTEHIQIDEEGNIVIEAENFDISTNGLLKLKSFNDIELNASNDVIISAESEINANGPYIKMTGEYQTDILTNDGMTIIKGNNLAISSDNNIEIVSESGFSTFKGGSIELETYDGNISIASYNDVILTADASIEVKLNDRFVSNKELEVVI